MRSLTEGFSKLYSVRMYYGQISGLMFHTFKIHQRKNAEPESVLRFKTTAKNNNDTVTEARLRGKFMSGKLMELLKELPKIFFFEYPTNCSLELHCLPTGLCVIYQLFNSLPMKRFHFYCISWPLAIAVCL